MRKRNKILFALAAFVLLSALGLWRPRERDHDSGLTADALTAETTQEGNRETLRYLDAGGRVTTAIDRGYAIRTRTVDENGRVVLEVYQDEAGLPVRLSGRYAGVAYAYGDEEIRITYLDEHLSPTVLSSGYTSIQRTLDENGRALEDHYYDRWGARVKCSGGYFGLRREYDAAGQVCGIVYLDMEGNPTVTASGYSREVRKSGNPSEVSYFDLAGNPAALSLGQYGERYSRDENGRVAQVTYLNAAGAPAPTNVGYTTVKRTYHRDGTLWEEFYLDETGAPVALSKGQYGIRRVGDVSLQLDRQGRLLLSIDNLLSGYPVAVVAAGCLLCAAMCLLPKKAGTALLGAYVVFIFYETLMFRETGDPRTDLIPFTYLRRFFTVYTVRAEVINNIWLFVPLGAGLYRCADRRGALWVPFLLSVGIELTQYVTGLGLMQTDDIIGNSLGGVIGFFAAACFSQWLQRE